MYRYVNVGDAFNTSFGHIAVTGIIDEKHAYACYYDKKDNLFASVELTAYDIVKFTREYNGCIMFLWFNK